MHVLAWSFLLYGDRWRSIVVLIDRVFQNQTILWLFSVHAMEHFDAEVEQVSQVLFRFSRFSQAYRARLWSGLRDAQSYFRQVLGKDLLRALKSAKDLDQLLGRYVIHRHNEAPRKKLSVVKHALLGYSTCTTLFEGNSQHDVAEPACLGGTKSGQAKASVTRAIVGDDGRTCKRTWFDLQTSS